MLGNSPTLPSASPRPPAGAAAAPAAAAAAAAARAPSSVGGTLVRHEVTAAHTRSLFCSLRLLFPPLGSDSCHAHRSRALLMRSRATRIAPPVPSPSARRIPTPPRSLGRFGDSLSPNGSCAQTPSLSPGHSALLCSQILTARQLRIQSAAWGPLPAPNSPGPRVRTANFACRFRGSPFTPPQDRPASPQHWENWPSPRRRTPSR